MKLILTCEHGGNEIPTKYANYFDKHQAILKTHRGFDLGALDYFKHLKPLADFSSFSKLCNFKKNKTASREYCRKFY